jgi:hypothetical protein
VVVVGVVVVVVVVDGKVVEELIGVVAVVVAVVLAGLLLSALTCWCEGTSNIAAMTNPTITMVAELAQRILDRFRRFRGPSWSGSECIGRPEPERLDWEGMSDADGSFPRAASLTD